ncbi:MAG: hypothetical protein HOV81_42030, partial [Kofleriaceae bacterium]|nr:hypothetical protein [Kofleriaceae bacterium]
RVVGIDLAFQIVDGVPLTATKPGSDGKLVGLYAHDCDVDFDDVRMRTLITPEPSAQLGPDETRCP